MDPTAEQCAIFDHILDPEAGNLQVNAGAGVGKTSTMIEAMRRMPEARRRRCVYVVFGKDNAREAQERLRGSGVQASTLHSVGFEALREGAPRGIRYKPDEGKFAAVWRQLILVDGEEEAFSDVRRLVDLARSVGIGVLDDAPDEVATWRRLAETHEIMGPGDVTLDRLVDIARMVLRDMIALARKGVIDFTDMIYLPLHPAFHARFYTRWGDILVDEDQDLSPVQVELVWRMGGPSARYSFVGDRLQSIYGWRGAGANMVDYIRDRFACRELPLSTCWRCGSSIVAAAQAYSPTLRAAPNASAGEVVRVPPDQGLTVPDGVMVLCRTSAPLVRQCMALLAAGRRATVKGKDIGRSLAALVRAAVKRSKATTITAAVEAVRDDVAEITAKALGQGHDVRAANLADREAAVRAIAERLPGAAKPAELIRAIDDLFSDLARAPSKGVLFCTIHKAKGAEADEVWWMDPHRTCLSAASRAAVLDEDQPDPWQAVQEDNCKYVAITRARRRLVMLAEDSLQA